LSNELRNIGIAVLTRREIDEIKKAKQKATTSMICRNYGINHKQYEEMFIQQENKCAICGSPQVGTKRLSIDHCHKTGKVRALLCQKCNFGLGFFRDNVELLEKAKQYLIKHNQEQLDIIDFDSLRK